jgi:hypothetical protein
MKFIRSAVSNENAALSIMPNCRNPSRASSNDRLTQKAATMTLAVDAMESINGNPNRCHQGTALFDRYPLRVKDKSKFPLELKAGTVTNEAVDELLSNVAVKGEFIK